MEEDELEMPRQVYFQKLRIQNIMTGRNRQRTEGDNHYIKTVSSSMTGDDLMEKLDTMNDTLEKLKVVYGRISKSYKPTNSHEKMTKDEFETWLASLCDQMDYFKNHIQVNRPSKKKKKKRGKSVVSGKKKKFKSEVRSPLTQQSGSESDMDSEDVENIETTLSLTRDYYKGDGCKNCLSLVDRIEKMELVMDGYSQREALLKRQNAQLQQTIEMSKKKVISTINNKDYKFVYTEETQKHIEEIEKIKFQKLEGDLSEVAKTKQRDMFKSLKKDYQTQLTKINNRIERHRSDYLSIVTKIQCMNQRFALYSTMHHFQKNQLINSSLFKKPTMKREDSVVTKEINKALQENKMAQQEVLQEQSQEFGLPPTKGNMVILFHSIQGATVLWDILPKDMLDAMTIYYNLCKVIMLQYGGYLIDLDADSHWIAFSDIKASLDYIKTLSTELLNQEWPEALLRHPLAEIKTSSAGKEVLFRGLRLRMAVHSCPVDCMIDAEKKVVLYNDAGIAHCKLLEKFANGGDVLISNDYWNHVKPYLDPNSIVSNRFDAMNINPQDFKSPITPITPRDDQPVESEPVIYNEFSVSSLGTKTLDDMGTKEKIRRLTLSKLKKRSHASMLQRTMSKVFLPVDQDERRLNNQIKELIGQQQEVYRFMNYQKMDIRYKMEIDALETMLSKKEDYIQYLLNQIPKNPGSTALPAALTNEINKHLDSMQKHKKVSTRNKLILDHLSDVMKTDIQNLQREIDKINHVFVEFPEFRQLEGADDERQRVRTETANEIQFLEAKDTINSLRRDVKKYKRAIKKLEEDLEENEEEVSTPTTNKPTSTSTPKNAKRSSKKKKKKKPSKRKKKTPATPTPHRDSYSIKLPKLKS